MVKDILTFPYGPSATIEDVITSGLVPPNWTTLVDGDKGIYKTIVDIYIPDLDIFIPAGFLTDFASVPFGFRLIIPRRGRHSIAALVHDFLYLIGYSRREADYVFLTLMRKAGVRVLRRAVMFATVRLFGGIHKLCTKRRKAQKQSSIYMAHVKEIYQL